MRAIEFGLSSDYTGAEVRVADPKEVAQVRHCCYVCGRSLVTELMFYLKYRNILLKLPQSNLISSMP